ncbi:hypothetical protein LIER_24249 [Lithospermum erythrorhizon]|uniref:Uncharacterized protein n=1 Tax=Lithospermum erythrorhizon TaxID=34254 RepID=A0AAV3R3Q8_LITER
MAEINPTLPRFFNMHTTSYSGLLTSFSAARYYNIFADPKPDKVVEGRWHSKWCFMRGGMCDTVPKRWTSLAEALHPKFKKIALIKAQIATLKWIFDPPSSNIPHKEPLDDSTGLPPSLSDSLPDEGSDSAPRAKTGYSANYLNFPYTLLGGVHKLERLQLVHNQTTKKVGELEQKVKSAEEAFPQQVQKAIFDYHRSDEFSLEAGKESVYCLCCFTKTYRDVNPSIVAN